LVGSLGWVSAQDYSIAPASSKVVRKLPSMALSKLYNEFSVAKRAADRIGMKIQIAEAKVLWKQSSCNEINSRIKAERAKYLPELHATAEGIDRLSHQASIQEKASEWQKKVYHWSIAQEVLAQAEAMAPEDANRAKQIETASLGLAKAQAELEAAGQLKDQAQKAEGSAASYKPLSTQYPKTSTGRRRALASWISSAKNPLTARVGVNHLWMRHFQQPLVKTVFDFGRNGASPSHPELLDWLAVEFMESGWSIKHLHRLIVTSEAYQRQSSASGNPSLTRDPENRWYWRMNPGRMEVEVLRDSILQLAGKLDSTMGGQELENKDIFTTWRRSLYYCCQPEEDGKSSLGMLFDGPDASDCYRRTRTVIPQQSLALTNSPLVHELSPLIAQQIESRLPPDFQTNPDRFVDAAYQTILGRVPSPQESVLCRDYLSDTTQTQSLRASLVRVLLNHSDFITIR
ncbi:MAG: Chromosome partition protein Smc, partial [Planctomycetota bacterium]